jgi:hypothetical protein
MTYHKDVWIFVRSAPRLVIITEQPNFEFTLITIMNPPGGEIVPAYEMKNQLPRGRNEICLCRLTKKGRYWIEYNKENQRILACRGQMKAKRKKGETIKLIWINTKEVPSLKLLCHLHITPSMEKATRKFIKNLTNSIYTLGHKTNLIFSNFGTEYETCKCDRKGSLPVRILLCVNNGLMRLFL